MPTPATPSIAPNGSTPPSASNALGEHHDDLKAPPSSLVFLLAAGGGLAVASIYYSQPMLGALGAEVHVSDQTIGMVPMLTQFGYALGILFLAPLGDRFDRRSIILIKAFILTLALLAAGLAPNIHALLIASLAVGVSATMAQDIVPAAAAIAPLAQRGKIVGSVMTGLLMGILLSRVVSGLVAQSVGWRAMFIAAAVSIALVGAAIWRGVPRFKPTTQLGYGALLGSLWSLWRRHGALRRATIAQGFISIAFSAFWSTLAVMLHGAPFHLGSAAAGAFGLAGAAGALIAPIAGRIADRRGPGLVTRLGALVAAASYAVMFLMPMLSPRAQLYVLGLSAVGFDLGTQASLVSHQTIVYSIEPAARSRLNAILFVGMFLCMAAGAALGSLCFNHWGWMGVTALATIAALCALVVRMWPHAQLEALKP